MLLKLNLALVGILVTLQAHSALQPDRTRLIFNESEHATTIGVKNVNTSEPYLLQSWLEDSEGNKIKSPIIALPPVQRIEPAGKTLVKLQSLSDIKNLSNDRETLFYLNLREIPPKNTNPNVLTVALQSRLKVLFRPENLRTSMIDGLTPGVRKITIKPIGKSYAITNPSQYYVTIVNIIDENKKTFVPNFSSLMIEPGHTKSLNLDISALNSFSLQLVNDYGGIRNLIMKCNTHECFVDKIRKPNEKGF